MYGANAYIDQQKRLRGDRHVQYFAHVHAYIFTDVQRVGTLINELNVHIMTEIIMQSAYSISIYMYLYIYIYIYVSAMIYIYIHIYIYILIKYVHIMVINAVCNEDSSSASMETPSCILNPTSHDTTKV